jgi:hypothetical protein
VFLQAQGAILSGVGYSEEGYRVRMEGARLGGEDYLPPRQGIPSGGWVSCPPDRVPLWTTLVSNVSNVSDVSIVSVVSVLKKAYPCKGRGYT